MQVFKACLKVIKKNLISILIYFCIFLGIAIASSTLMPNNQVFGDFESSKIEIAFVNHDEDTELVQGFYGYLESYAEYKDIAENKLQDALFYRDVEYIITVPDGFTADFLAGKSVQLDKTTISDSTNGYFADQLADRYFSTAKLYLVGNPDITQKELTATVVENLELDTTVTLQDQNISAQQKNDSVNFFNMMAYAIIGVFTLATSSIIMVFNKTDLRRRNLCSPINLRKTNSQMAGANILFCLIMWAVMLTVGILIYGRSMTGGRSGSTP